MAGKDLLACQKWRVYTNLFITKAATMDDAIGNNTNDRQHYSILHCLNEKGQIIVNKYIMSRRQEENDLLEAILVNEQPQVDALPRTRSCKRKDCGKVCDDGVIHLVLPADSIWYMSYINTPEVEDDHFQKQFKNRFRIPFQSFLDISAELKSAEMFQRWCGRDCTGLSSTPLELLLLGALRILSRDAKCDDLTEYTAINKETHRQFFHSFLLYGSTVLYNRYVVMPRTKEELMPHLQYYARKGLHGAFGSMDATHIASKRIPNGMKQLHTGYKLPYTARAYNVTVNNQRRILHSTSGCPARWNDKTIVLYDNLYNLVKSHELGGDVEFELFYYDVTNQKICKQKYCGVWFLVDNGYHSVSCTIPPFKNPGYTDQYVWSEWVESTRKDVECIFGMMKGRFLILGSPIRYHGVGVIDKIWKSCCALHNLILDTEVVNENVNNDDDIETKNYLELPDAENMRYTTGIGNPVDFADNNEYEDPTYKNGCGMVIPIKLLNMNTFRSRLVQHFTICKCNGLATWK